MNPVLDDSPSSVAACFRRHISSSILSDQCLPPPQYGKAFSAVWWMLLFEGRPSSVCNRVVRGIRRRIGVPRADVYTESCWRSLDTEVLSIL